MTDNFEGASESRDAEQLVQRSLLQIKNNISSVEPSILGKFEAYCSGRYGRNVVVTHEDSKVRVDLRVQYVDIKEVSLNLAPFIKPVDPTDLTIGFQPTRFNFDKIDLTNDEQLKGATHIWEGVDEKDKQALCLKEIFRMRGDDVATIAGIPDQVAKGKMKESDGAFFRKNANERIETLNRLEQSIKAGKVEFILNKGDASLTVKAR